MPDFKPHGFKFAAQLMIPEAQHFDALFREKTVSLFISGPLIRETVSTAIQFHSQLRDGAVEIENVDAARVLSAELELVETMVA